MNAIDLAFFCSPIGLGHASRDLAVSEFIDVPFKFVTGGAAAQLISKYGFAIQNSYKQPDFGVKNGKLGNMAGWLLRYYNYYKECKKIATQFIEKENPKLVLSDEDFASLVVAQKKNIPCILITDILYTRFTNGIFSIVEKKMNQTMKQIIQNCDLVVMPEFGDNEKNIARVGPIVRKTTSTREQLRKKFSFTKKTVLLTVGGTDAGQLLIEKTIQAYHNLKTDCELVLASGPSLKPNTEFRNFGFASNLHELIYAADVLVSLAGKSTIHEAKAYGTPGIFIPIKNHFEQEDNAKQEGFTFEDIFRLDSLILQKLESPRNPIKADGAQKAWQLIRPYIK